MKTKSFAVIGSGTAMAALCLLGACFPPTSKAQTETSPAPPPEGSVAPAAPDDPAALPPGVYPSSPLAQVIKLTQSGVSEEVIMTYVTNSVSTFNLDPDKIIYLKDIGVPDDLVTAMMQRDQLLQAQMAATAFQPPSPPPAPAPETVAAEPAQDAMPVAQPAPVTVYYFYDSLTPYGTWVNVDGYGRCWRPTVVTANPGWQPYCDHGHWVYSSCGWYWTSDYTWGWAPFHYGRWFHHASFGWCWAPDTVWGPSWVTWRYSGDYCGWAPLPPFSGYASGIGFTYRGASVGVDFTFGLGASVFTFVPTRNFCDPHPRRYRVDTREAGQIYSHTTVINNFEVDNRSRDFINHGIDPQRITEVTHTPIRPVVVRDATTPIGRGEQLGHDGRTLVVNRPHFTDNPPPSVNRGEAPHTSPPALATGNPYQPSPGGGGNTHSQPTGRYQSAPPMPTPGQPQNPPAYPPGSPGHIQTMTPTAPLANRHASIAPAQPISPVSPGQQSAPNYNTADNRRYPTPHMQQSEQQNPRANPGNPGGSVGAPATIPAPPVRQPAPSQAPPAESRASYSQPNAAGNQPHSAPAPPSTPAPSQRSGGSRNQNGQ